MKPKMTAKLASLFSAADRWLAPPPPLAPFRDSFLLRQLPAAAAVAAVTNRVSTTTWFFFSTTAKLSFLVPQLSLFPQAVVAAAVFPAVVPAAVPLVVETTVDAVTAGGVSVATVVEFVGGGGGDDPLVSSAATGPPVKRGCMTNWFKTSHYSDVS